MWIQACREGLGMVPSVLPCSMGSSGSPLMSLQAGCEHCFTTLGLNSGVPLPVQLLFVLQEPLWTIFPGSQREGIAERNSLHVFPPLYLYFVHSLFKIWICNTLMWAMLCVLRCPSQIKPWLRYSTPCLMEGCFQSIDFGATAPVYLRGLRCWCKHGVVIRNGVSAQGWVHGVLSNWWWKRCLFCCWPFLLPFVGAVPWIPVSVKWRSWGISSELWLEVCEWKNSESGCKLHCTN